MTINKMFTMGIVGLLAIAAFTTINPSHVYAQEATSSDVVTMVDSSAATQALLIQIITLLKQQLVILQSQLAAQAKSTSQSNQYTIVLPTGSSSASSNVVDVAPKFLDTPSFVPTTSDAQDYRVSWVTDQVTTSELYLGSGGTTGTTPYYTGRGSDFSTIVPRMGSGGGLSGTMLYKLVISANGQSTTVSGQVNGSGDVSYQEYLTHKTN